MKITEIEYQRETNMAILRPSCEIPEEKYVFKIKYYHGDTDLYWIRYIITGLKWKDDFHVKEEVQQIKGNDYIVTYTLKKRQRMQEQTIDKISYGPAVFIREMSIRIKSRKELANPKSNPKLDLPTTILQIGLTGRPDRKSIVLIYRDGKLYWKNAPFKAINSEYFEKKIAEVLNAE